MTLIRRRAKPLDRNTVPFLLATDPPLTWGEARSSRLEPSFVFETESERILSYGVHRRFASASELENLRSALTDTSGRASGDGPAGSAREGDPAPVLVGALPFDPAGAPSLFQPRAWTRLPRSGFAATTEAVPLRTNGLRVRAHPKREEYARRVAQALERIRGRGPGSGGTDPAARLVKVVLARRLVVEAEAPFDPAAVLARLRVDRNVTTFAVPVMGPSGGEERVLVGATPELLVEKRGLRVTSLPLAGSAPRSRVPAADRALAEGLLRSEKDQAEHALVVEQVHDTLGRYCRDLRVPSRPTLASTGSMWHLATRVEGELRDADVSSYELARALHPTPAVCGVPTSSALAAISELEPFDRGFYGGVVGWCDAAGDGRWMVAIRCAELAGMTALLHAGAGIVEGSDPAAEAEETSAKFRTLLHAFGIDERGSPEEEEP